MPVLNGARAPLRVLVADDSAMIRAALGAMLGNEQEVSLAGVCADGNELRREIDREPPDVAVVDIRMPPSLQDEGIRLARELRSSHPRIGVVVLSQHVDPAYALDLMSEGTAGRGYLLKERVRDRSELVAAIAAVAGGGSVLDPLVVDALIAGRAREHSSPLDRLTPREREVLAGIAEGASNAAIADSLVLSKRAVEKHVNAVFAKLGLAEQDAGEISRRVTAALAFLDADGRLDRNPRPAG